MYMHVYLHAELYNPIAVTACMVIPDVASPKKQPQSIVLIGEWTMVEDWGFHALQGNVK